MDFIKENFRDAFDSLYATVVAGLPGCPSVAEEVVEIYMNSRGKSLDEVIDDQITLTTLKAAAVGFASGAGGCFALPISIPAEILGTIYLNLRQSLVIASLSGYSIQSETTRTFALLTLLGDSSKELLKSFAVQIGARATISLAQQLSPKLVLDINSRIIERLAVRLGFQTTGQFARWIPLVSGLIGSAIDGYFSYEVGKTAKRIFGQQRVEKLCL